MTGTDRISGAEELGEFLAGLAKGKKVLFIASVDFFHYLPAEKADEMDVWSGWAPAGKSYWRTATPPE
ncbi:MAG: hypothetical protein PWQ97_419 [Tepidanaerobacteraceae bacterium]|nr:hypothetical protein [Tepidanaerobacteraceae bacterium]